MSRSILWAMLLAILTSSFVAAAQPDKGDSAERVLSKVTGLTIFPLRRPPLWMISSYSRRASGWDGKAL